MMFMGFISSTMVAYGVDPFNSATDPNSPNFVDTTLRSSSGSGCQFASISNPKFQDLLSYGTCIIGTAVIPLIFALAIVVFLWGVVQFVMNSDEEAKKAKGKEFMMWGIIALAVMVSVWGLVSILGNTFGINAHFIPQVKPN
jgi:hypothetical protein